MATAMTKPGTHPAVLTQHSDGFFVCRIRSRFAMI